MAAHILLPWVHRVFANLKRWLTGTFHGARKQHLKRYLDEFTFRWNRRRHTRTAFDNLLGLVTRLPHASRRACRRERSAFRGFTMARGRVARGPGAPSSLDSNPLGPPSADLPPAASQRRTPPRTGAKPFGIGSRDDGGIDGPAKKFAGYRWFESISLQERLRT